MADSRKWGEQGALGEAVRASFREQVESSLTKVSSDIISLNVGGKLFQTTKTTLASHPESLLAAMFVSGGELVKDSTGAVFLDRDGDVFALVLSFLRTGVLPLIDDRRLQRAFAVELDYFDIKIPGEGAGDASPRSHAEGKLYEYAYKHVVLGPNFSSGMDALISNLKTGWELVSQGCLHASVVFILRKPNS
eukprot:jgi/Mesvir1/20352/Mv19938-RA.1